MYLLRWSHETNTKAAQQNLTSFDSQWKTITDFLSFNFTIFATLHSGRGSRWPGNKSTVK